jgi:hypothetical protein
MYIGLHKKCPLLLSESKLKLECVDKFYKSSPISNVMKICLAVLELIHADRQTDMKELIGAFSQLSVMNMPKKEGVLTKI